MITFFTTAKAFTDHFDVIQRNALQSWTQFPGCEVLLMGDDGGSAAVARELGLVHVPEIARNEHGSGLVNDMFARAEARGRNDLLCYVNADIILMSDFFRAAKRVRALKKPLLMCGRRQMVDVTSPVIFDEGWEKRLDRFARQSGYLDDHACVDYFLFTRGVFGEIPPFAIGRKRWDRWLQYRARSTGALYIDATPMVMAIHQNHDYGGRAGFVKHKAGTETERNVALAGQEYCDLRSATHKLTSSGVTRAIDRVRLQWRLKKMTGRAMRWIRRFERPLAARRDAPGARRLHETSRLFRRLIKTGRTAKAERMAIVGLGKIGLPLAASFIHKGVAVVGVDSDRATVAAIESGHPLGEPRVDALLAQNRHRLSLRRSLDRATNSTWLVLPTQKPDGSGYTPEYLLAACDTVGRTIASTKSYHLVVIVSTVLPGWTGGMIRASLERASGKTAGREFGLCYCPALVALGSAVDGFLAPDVAIIGESDPYSGDKVVAMFAQLWDRAPTIVRTNFVNAELTKLALNTFLSTKISFANVLAQMCEQLPEANVDVVTSALESDPRIGRGYLKGGMSYGGPCFLNDVPAFAAAATQLDASPDLAAATEAVNSRMVRHVLDLVEKTTGRDGTVGICGATFKSGSRVIAGSPGLAIAGAVAERGYRVVLFDRDADQFTLRQRTGLEVAASLFECVRQSNTIVLARSSAHFGSLKAKLRKAGKPRRAVIDCWRQLDAGRIATVADYHAIGIGPRAETATAVRCLADPGEPRVRDDGSGTSAGVLSDTR